MLSQATGYAVHALGFLAASGGKPILIKEMARACEIPTSYLAKIVSTLARRGIVQTQRGVGGGVTLVKAPADLTLYELCEALDDPVIQSRCLLNTAECTDDRDCPAHHFWKPHRLRQIAFLRETCVSDIAAFETRRRWARPE